MIRRLIAAVAAALGVLAGLWLALSPFALGTQPDGRDWTRPTTVTVASGGAVALVGLIGFLGAATALVGLTRRYGSARPGGLAPAESGTPTDADPAVPDLSPTLEDAATPAEVRTISPDELLSAVLPALVADLTGTSSSADGDAGSGVGGAAVADRTGSAFGMAGGTRAMAGAASRMAGDAGAMAGGASGVAGAAGVMAGAASAVAGGASGMADDASRTAGDASGSVGDASGVAGGADGGRTEDVGGRAARADGPGVPVGAGAPAVEPADTASIGRFPRRPSVGVNGHTGPAWSGFLHPAHEQPTPEQTDSTVADAVHGRGRAMRYSAEVRREGA